MTTRINLIPDRSGPGIKTAALLSGSSRGGSDKYATGESMNQKKKITKEVTMIGTWNVRSMKQSGKMEILVQEMERMSWNILGISEMRWKGTGQGTTEEGHKIWYSGDDKKFVHGVGFLINKNIRSSVMEFTPINERIAGIRIAGNPFNLSIIQVYAPTSDCDEDQIEEFYHDLENFMKTVPKKDIIVVQGDWNAKIGQDAYDSWKGTIGKFGLGETNERGQKLLEFAKRHQLTAANTLFNHKTSRRTTWHSPNGVTHNQIDYIFISKRFVTGVNKANTRSFNKPDIGSDHDLVMMALKVKLKVNRKSNENRTHYDIEKLKDPQIAKQFQEELAGRFEPLRLLDQDSQQLCDKFTNIMEEVSAEKLGKPRKIKKPWMTKELIEKCDDRRDKRRKRELGAVALEEYRIANRSVRNELAETKNKWIENQAGEIEENLSKNNTKIAYKIVKKLCDMDMEGIKRRPAGVIEDRNGNLLTKNEEITKRWKEYCEELYNYVIQKDLRVMDEPVQVEDIREEEEILLTEVEYAIKELKKGKAPGADNIKAEQIQAGGEATAKMLHKMCNVILRTKEWPNQWTESVLITIPKKANTKKCSEHRTISLISHASKVMLKIIQKRLTPRIEEVLSESQAGFRSGRSTTEQITTVRILNEKARDSGNLIFHNFIDFRKAFDRVWHDALWHTMRKFNIGEGMTILIQKLYEKARSKVMIDEEYSEWFRTNVGVRQGCLLSPTLFNLFLERIMMDAMDGFDGGVSCAGRKIAELRFADDIDLMEASEEGIQELTRRVDNSSKKFGMEISAEKSKVMVAGNKESIDGKIVNVEVDGKKLEQVTNFTYLGSKLVNDGKSEKEIRIRIGRATSALAKLENIWRSKNIKIKNKLLLMRSIVSSTLLYACESWTMNKSDEKRLKAFETKSYRRLLGITWKDRKTNEYVMTKIQEICGFMPEGVVEMVKKKKLKYFGHQIRSGGTTRAVMEGGMEGNRGRGRPQCNWMGNMREWCGKGTGELINMAKDRHGWRKAVYDWVHPRPPRLRS